MAPLMKADIKEIPKPLPDTTIISTNSLLLLKYCPTIKVLESLVIPTPIPKRKQFNIIKTKSEIILSILLRI